MTRQSHNIPPDLDRKQVTRIIDLMRERERAFVKVWQCEQRIRSLLCGAPFPFPTPPNLPSTKRRRKTRVMPPPSEDIRVRRLKPGEEAYRITLRIGDRSTSFLQDGTETIRALLELPDSEAKPIRLETVRLNEKGEPTTVKCLWESSVQPRKPTGSPEM